LSATSASKTAPGTQQNGGTGKTVIAQPGLARELEADHGGIEQLAVRG